MKSKTFVFDTNTLISANLIYGSVSYKALKLAKREGNILNTPEMFNEFIRCFILRKFDRYASFDDRMGVIVKLKEGITFIKVLDKVTICRDPDDDKFLALAVAANASCIITGDKDLQILNPYENIPILSPAEFLSYFNEFDDSLIINEPYEAYGAVAVI